MKTIKTKSNLEFQKITSLLIGAAPCRTLKKQFKKSLANINNNLFLYSNLIKKTQGCGRVPHLNFLKVVLIYILKIQRCFLTHLHTKFLRVRQGAAPLVFGSEL